MNAISPLKILVAPLDWGLGHTTRCVPVIEELKRQGATVILAGNKEQQALLAPLFPNCRFLPLEGYRVRYSKSGGGFFLKMLRQAPRILAAIRRENKWLRRIVDELKIDGVISDNRFGLYAPGLPCAFITHQLQLQTKGGRLSAVLARRMNYRYIHRFSTCWIPDFPGLANLAGSLSHPDIMPGIVCRYIGALSRIELTPHVEKNERKIVFLLSGPEPQRTIFEQKIISQIGKLDYHPVIVRGVPLETEMPAVKNATIFNHLSKSELSTLLQEAAFVVCRSGYSSVMDINQIRARSILVPTPGQTEQLYLGDYLMKKGFALMGNQEDLDLPALINRAVQFDYDGFVNTDDSLLREAVGQFLQLCNAPVSPS
ncbi:glycosyltransferase [Niabella insulamsoli]|uniref:glycosyltransferase n=1 Tax=Niabella insulamsoli TaxID=3144874 RepID=UPI0031FDA1BB